MLTRPTLQELRGSIAEAAGREVSDEVLFRLGRRWGQAEADQTNPDDDERTRFEAGLRRLGEFGLGTARIDTFEHDDEGRDLRVSGYVHDPTEVKRRSSCESDSATPDTESAARAETEDGSAASLEDGSQGTACGLTVGYLTGLAAGISGLDVVCSPFTCPRSCLGDECASPGCAFELRPAHTLTSPAPRAPAPSGSARFFLRALGASFGTGDISLEDLLERTGDAVILIDLENVIRFWNRGAEEMFGYPREEVVGREIGFIVPPDLLEKDELNRIRDEIERNGSLTNFVTRRLPRAGPELTVSLTRTVLHDSSGAIVGSTAVIRDVTEQMRTEKALREAQHMALVGEMAATVAHGIKNPLAGIYAAIQHLAKSPALGRDEREVFDGVGDEIRRLDETVQDLLRFARPLSPRSVPTELEGLVREVFTELGHHPDVGRHELRCDVDGRHVVSIDPEMIRLVFVNLILNAAQAMSERGVVRVAVLEERGKVVITVSDTGLGVPVSIRSALFEPFVTSKTRGTGLGLCIAKKNVESHGGKLDIADDGSGGGGSTFRISLPTSLTF